MRRRVFLLLVLAAAAAAAVAYRVRRRPREGDIHADAWTTFGAAGGPQPPRDRAREPAPRAVEEAPTGGPAMVTATMEATPASAETRFDGNGSATVVTERLPTTAGSEAALGSIELGPVGLPARRRLSGATLAALGALAGVGAIALGAWGVASSVSGDSGPTETAALENVQQIVSLISKPTSARIPIQGSGGRIILVVGARGYGVLVLDRLAPPPPGKTYQAWVIKPSAKAPVSAGVFSGKDAVVRLTTPVPPGAVVAITVERAGGAPAPTQKPKLLATRT